MSDFFKRQNESAAEYEWRYEYYDYEEPVSFEGLKANRYSIVIGFWVGLAVFVIFMFFVLTLLTKTGAPQPDAAEACEKRVRLTDSADHLSPPSPASATNNDDPACPSHQLLDASLFQCYIRGEEEQQQQQQGDSWARAPGPRTGAGPGGSSSNTGLPKEGALMPSSSRSSSSYTEEAEGMAMLGVMTTSSMSGSRADAEEALAHFNIPNFVSSEPGEEEEDDPLLWEPEPEPMALDGGRGLGQ